MKTRRNGCRVVGEWGRAFERDSIFGTISYLDDTTAKELLTARYLSSSD